MSHWAIIFLKHKSRCCLFTLRITNTKIERHQNKPVRHNTATNTKHNAKLSTLELCFTEFVTKPTFPYTDVPWFCFSARVVKTGNRVTVSIRRYQHTESPQPARTRHAAYAPAPSMAWRMAMANRLFTIHSFKIRTCSDNQHGVDVPAAFLHTSVHNQVKRRNIYDHQERDNDSLRVGNNVLVWKKSL